MTDQTITIATHTLNVNLQVELSEPEAVSWIQNFQNKKFLPVLEKILTTASKEDIHLNKLELDLSGSLQNFENEDWEQALEQQIKSALQKLPRKIQGQSSNKTQIEKSNPLVFYLKNGYWPWWAKEQGELNHNSLFQTYWKPLVDQSDFWKEFEPYEEIILRLTHAFSFNEIKSWAQKHLKGIGPMHWKDLNNIQSALKGVRHREQFRGALKKRLTESLCARKSATEFEENMLAHFKTWSDNQISQAQTTTINIQLWKTFFDKTQKSIEPHKTLHQPKLNDKKNSENLNEEVVFIPNAGMILLANYLPTLFNQLKYTKAQNLIQTERALHLLHFLATGKKENKETEWPLYKLLCGLPLSFVVKEEIRLTSEDVNEAETLLAQAIAHWTVLKNTSPDGLRHSFLQRSGKLSFRDMNIGLRVQHETHDILLNHLPWSFSMVKLPWMKKAIQTDWTI